MGGDRDGHPFVTGEMTRRSLEELRATALRVLRQQLENLAGSLSLSEFVQPAPPRLPSASPSARGCSATAPPRRPGEAPANRGASGST